MKRSECLEVENGHALLFTRDYNCYIFQHICQYHENTTMDYVCDDIHSNRLILLVLSKGKYDIT